MFTGVGVGVAAGAARWHAPSKKSAQIAALQAKDLKIKSGARLDCREFAIARS